MLISSGRVVLGFAINMEHAGTVVERHLLGLVTKGIRNRRIFQKGVQAELLGLIDRLIANARTADSLSVAKDVRVVRVLAAEKQTFRDMEAQTTTAHLERPHMRGPETASSLYLDILGKLKRVNAHLVATRYPALENEGGMLPRRLWQDD